MVFVYFACFSVLFLATTPLDSGDALMSDGFPWLTLVHKLLVFFSIWEALGLGAIHGPLSGKFAPPFQDWWYRMTPGTMKWPSPFFKAYPYRNYLDVLVEGFLFCIFA